MVIALIAILATLLLPVLRKSRQSAQNTVCKCNLRQVGIALAAYTADFGAYPFFSEGLNGASTAWFWPELLEPCSGVTWDPSLEAGRADARSRLYLCPGYAALPGLYDPEPVSQYDSHWYGAYAYNWRGVWGKGSGDWFLGLGGAGPGGANADGSVPTPPTRDSEVLSPNGMIAVCDAPLSAAIDARVFGLSDFSYQGVGAYDYEFESGQVVSGSARAYDPRSRQKITFAIKNRHSSKWNVVFCDGHVQPHKTKELFDWRDNQSSG